MAIRVVRLGEERYPDEGTRLGTVRRPPRGVKKSDFAKRNFYDAWVPDLAPSAQLLSWVKVEDMTDARWKRFTKEYRREMKEPAAERIIHLLAVMSRESSFSVGCYCEDAAHCHRRILAELLDEAGASMVED